MYDIAAATQQVFEYCLLNLATWTKIKTRSKNLALAGGGALNRQAVALLTRWDSVHVPTNPGDPGSCIGAVLAKTKQRTRLGRKWHR
jgi:predicted NodU family carbamoyl transferase